MILKQFRESRNYLLWSDAAAEVVAVASTSPGCWPKSSGCFDLDAGLDEAHEKDPGGQRGDQLPSQSGSKCLATGHHTESRNGTCEHALAELEQMVHLEKKTKQTPANREVPEVS